MIVVDVCLRQFITVVVCLSFLTLKAKCFTSESNFKSRHTYVPQVAQGVGNWPIMAPNQKGSQDTRYQIE